MIETDNNGYFRNAKRAQSKFSPEKDGAELNKIMELYNYLTEGKIAKPKVK